MAIAVSDLRISVRGLIYNQRWQNSQWYRLEGAAFLTATPSGVGEAYWNHVKSAWRGFVVANSFMTFESVFVEEPGSDGQYGEYAVPVGEVQGTRAGGTQNDPMPPFCAAGVRLTVGSRATRPGQKRFIGLVDTDNVIGVLQSAAATALGTLATLLTATMVLGAPVATGSLHPEIVTYNPITHSIEAYQDVTGFVINPNITTQNSRKVGRGI